MFTYVLDALVGTTFQTIAHVRLQLGDTVEDEGVFPDGKNLSDEEIQFVLDQNDGNVHETVAELARIVARRWASVVDVSVGPRREMLSQAAKRWQELAEAWGKRASNDLFISYSYAPRRRELDSTSEY